MIDIEPIAPENLMRVSTLTVRRFVATTLCRSRFFSVPFVGLLVVVATTIFTPQLSGRAEYCLMAGYGKNNQWYTRWGDPATGHEIDFAGKPVAMPFPATYRP